MELYLRAHCTSSCRDQVQLHLLTSFIFIIILNILIRRTTDAIKTYNNNIYLLQLGCYPVAVVILHGIQNMKVVTANMTLVTANMKLVAANMTLVTANMTLVTANMKLVTANMTLVTANVTLVTANMKLVTANMTGYC